MAITVRRLVEENEMFMNDKIAYKATNNLTEKDNASLTTIGNLYDIVTIIISKLLKNNSKKLNELKYFRPTDDELKYYYIFVCDMFKKISNAFPELMEFLNTDNITKSKRVIKKYRSKGGGNLLFRPIGLTIIFEILSKFINYYTLDESIKLLSGIPLDLNDVPYKWVLFNSNKSNINPKGRALTRDVLLFMLNYNFNEKEVQSINFKYSKMLDKDASKINLPNKL